MTKKNSETKLTFNRADVMQRLWECADWFKEKAENTRTKLDPNTKARASLKAKEALTLSKLIPAFTQEEIELRIMALEKLLENSILIPKKEEKKS